MSSDPWRQGRKVRQVFPETPADNQASKGRRGKQGGQFPLCPVPCAAGAIALRALRGGEWSRHHRPHQETSDGDRFLGHLSCVFCETAVSAIFQAQLHSPLAV